MINANNITVINYLLLTFGETDNGTMFNWETSEGDVFLTRNTAQEEITNVVVRFGATEETLIEDLSTVTCHCFRLAVVNNGVTFYHGDLSWDKTSPYLTANI